MESGDDDGFIMAILSGTGIDPEEVKKINKDLVTYKRIKRMELRMEEFEKTTTHKIKRYKLEHK